MKWRAPGDTSAAVAETRARSRNPAAGLGADRRHSNAQPAAAVPRPRPDDPCPLGRAPCSARSATGPSPRPASRSSPARNQTLWGCARVAFGARLQVRRPRCPDMAELDLVYELLRVLLRGRLLVAPPALVGDRGGVDAARVALRGAVPHPYATDATARPRRSHAAAGAPPTSKSSTRQLGNAPSSTTGKLHSCTVTPHLVAQPSQWVWRPSSIVHRRRRPRRSTIAHLGVAEVPRPWEIEVLGARNGSRPSLRTEVISGNRLLGANGTRGDRGPIWPTPAASPRVEAPQPGLDRPVAARNARQDVDLPRNPAAQRSTGRA